MTEIPAPLAAHLDCDVTTLCHCWKLTRTDGTVSGFTDHDRTLTVAATVFEPESGLAPTEARQSLGLAPDAIDVAGALTTDLIKDEDIEAGLYDRAEVETYLVNWRDPSMFMTIRQAVIGKISRADGKFVAELESHIRSHDQPNGRYFRKSCDAELGDAKCAFDLTQPGYEGSGSVAAIVADNIVEVLGLDGFANGWFSNGRITWTNGQNIDQLTAVITHEASGGYVSLTLDVRQCAKPAVGDQFTITAGCDKRFSTCKSKFSNALNFRGFPHLPGNDAAYAYAREGEIFDGGPLVP